MPRSPEYCELAAAFHDLLDYSKALAADAAVVLRVSAAQSARLRHAVELLFHLVPPKRRGRARAIVARLSEQAEAAREQIEALPTGPGSESARAFLSREEIP